MHQPISLRPAQIADAPLIADLHVVSWREAYASILDPDFLAGPIGGDRLALWSRRLQDAPPQQIVLVAETQGGEMAGFVCAYRNHDERWGSWIDNLHVLPSLRGQRIGEQLLSSVAHQLAEPGDSRGLYLWVFEANKAALRFYKHLDGRVVDRDFSRLPAAGGQPILRIHWLTPAAIRRIREPDSD
jgi:ribosomal protein S18 acetylase RimI-like enzyme